MIPASIQKREITHRVGPHNYPCNFIFQDLLLLLRILHTANFTQTILMIRGLTHLCPKYWRTRDDRLTFLADRLPLYRRYGKFVKWRACKASCSRASTGAWDFILVPLFTELPLRNVRTAYVTR